MEDITTGSNDQEVNEAHVNEAAGDRQSIPNPFLIYCTTYYQGQSDDTNRAYKDALNDINQHQTDLPTRGAHVQPLVSQYQQGNISVERTHPSTSPDIAENNNRYHANGDEPSHGAVASHCGDIELLMIFENFIDAGPDSFLVVRGDSLTLDSLVGYLLYGIRAQRFEESFNLSPFTPVTIALNVVCAQLSLPLVTESSLHELTSEGWFLALVKVYVEMYHVQHPLSVLNLHAGCVLDIHSIYLLVKAVQYTNGLPSIDLGIVFINNDQTIQASRFLCTGDVHGPTAWMLADGQSGPHIFHGIGNDPKEQTKVLVSDDDEESEDRDEEYSTPATPTPISTPRATAKRTLALQVPPDQGITADDLLHNHPENLHYNNILKVALTKGNHEMFNALKNVRRVGKSQKMQINKPSGVAKRITTALNFLAKEFGISYGKLRAAFDSARKANDVAVRSKEEFDDTGINTESALIDAVMEWVQRGGPMPVALATAHAAHAESVGPATDRGPIPHAVASGATTLATASEPVPNSPSISDNYGFARENPDHPFANIWQAGEEPNDPSMSHQPDGAVDYAAIDTANYSNSNQMGMHGGSAGSPVDLTASSSFLEPVSYGPPPVSPGLPSPPGYAPASTVPYDHQPSDMASHTNEDTQMADNSNNFDDTPMGGADEMFNQGDLDTSAEVFNWGGDDEA